MATKLEGTGPLWDRNGLRKYYEKKSKPLVLAPIHTCPHLPPPQHFSMLIYVLEY